MSVFRKRETPVENIAFLAICAGIDAVLSLVCALLSASALILMLVIPLTSAVASFYCKAKYFPIYLVASAGVCLAISAWNISNTLFYVIPSLLTGAAYGFGIKNRLTSSFVLFICSVLSFGLFYASMLLVKALLEVDVRDSLLALVRLSDKEGAAIGFPLFIYGYSLAQMAIAHLFIFIQMQRFEPIEEIISFKWGSPILAILSGGAASILAFFLPPYGLLAFGFSVYWGVLCIVELVQENRKISYLFLGIFAVAGLFLYAGLYRSAAPHGGLALLGSIALGVGFAQLINLILLRLKREDPKILP